MCKSYTILAAQSLGPYLCKSAHLGKTSKSTSNPQQIEAFDIVLKELLTGATQACQVQHSFMHCKPLSTLVICALTPMVLE